MQLLQGIVPLIVAGFALLPPVCLVAQFKSGVNLVEVYATVTDRHGEPVTNLGAADFRVLEDGRPQAISAFAAGEFPLSVLVALDRSFSMAGQRLTLAKQAARTFIAALRPADRVSVLGIGSVLETLVPMGPARAAASAQWAAVDAWGTTPLYDATIEAIARVEPEAGRRALIVISDGADRDSTATAAEMLDRARRSGVLVYPVGIGAARPPVFGELATVTGGRSFFVNDPKRLEEQLRVLARELRTQYLIGYVPSDLVAGPRWHGIEVTVNRSDVSVRARDGYFSR